MANATAVSADVNARFNDLADIANELRPIAKGGTGASTVAGARTALGIGTVAFFARSSASQAVSAGSWTTVTFDAEDYDVGNDFASNAFTVPETGLYLLGGGYNIQITGSAPADARVGLSVNAASPSNAARNILPSAAITNLISTPSVVRLLSLTSGDAIRLQAFFTTNGASLAGTNNTYFWGIRLS